jgi:hypothetical protein
VTGKHISGTPLEIRNCQQVLEQLAAELFTPAETRSAGVISKSLDLSNHELIECAKHASNGIGLAAYWLAMLLTTRTTIAEPTLRCVVSSHSGLAETMSQLTACSEGRV